MKQVYNVDFPAPFGPMMACTVPGSTSRFTSCNAFKPPKRLLTFRTNRIAIIKTSPNHALNGGRFGGGRCGFCS
jgi:hypothetical protein